MRSCIVVTSWWSNCLALTCLLRLVEFVPKREIYVMQAGKSDSQMDLFREFLPPGVTELRYPRHLLADDSPMREYLARTALRDHEGAWFIDHDTFLLASADPWFSEADALFDRSDICLCTRRPASGAGVTQPAYWLSPRRLPRGLSSFDPVPFRAKPYARRPDLHRHDGHLAIPGKDTLVQVREELEAGGLTGTLSLGDDLAGSSFLASFPPHDHIGGLHLYTGPVRPPAGMPPAFLDWRWRIVERFEQFFRECPPQWLAIEDPELLRRHREMAIETGCAGQVPTPGRNPPSDAWQVGV
jgi:hypothetical protein